MRFQKTRKTLSSFKRGDQTTKTTNKQLTEAQQRPIEFKHPFGSQHFRLNKLCYVITRNLFCDLIRLRYGWNLTRILRRCECGSNLTIEHALSCKKGGFVSLRHYHLRNISSSTKYVMAFPPMLHKLTSECFKERS